MAANRLPGLRLIHDAKRSQAQRKDREHQHALKHLRGAVNLKVAFAVKANATYDGALEDESPIQKKTISFKKDDFLHIYKASARIFHRQILALCQCNSHRYSSDWWIGRVVAAETTIGFIPTARRLARLIEQNEEEPEKPTTTAGKNAINQASRDLGIPQPVHGRAVNSSDRAARAVLPVVKANPTHACSSEVGDSEEVWKSRTSLDYRHRRQGVVQIDVWYDLTSIIDTNINERELRLITAMTEDLHLILLECPNISTPADVAHLNMAPIMFLFRISNRKILLKLLKKTGIKGGNAIAGADVLNQLAPDQVDVIIEDNGLNEATKKIFKFLEAYWLALHPTTPILEEEYLEKSASSEQKEEAHRDA
ncbi:dihydropyridine sensitive L-type calcium channel [Ancylostoma ceylanicum]|uniref:Dihydropyridine sensitive L-type calcium channel n=1 Tax=Ancylostoma ceylanicum TaxID=53326 RepID=A0A0D6M5Y1_9BILA|nr:dihydropyridine sensitive L-type calcium channel [Ancylostoma ceylanicum]